MADIWIEVFEISHASLGRTETGEVLSRLTTDQIPILARTVLGRATGPD